MNDAGRAVALADRFWEELLEREPIFATAIGDERYDDRLPDIGEEGRGAVGDPEPLRARRARHDRSQRPSTSRSARPWTSSRPSRPRHWQPSSFAPTGSTWPTTSSAPASCSETSPRSSERTPPSTSSATSTAPRLPGVPGGMRRDRARGHRDGRGLTPNGRRAGRRADRAHRRVAGGRCAPARRGRGGRRAGARADRRRLERTPSPPRSPASSTCSASTSRTPRRATRSPTFRAATRIYAAEIRSWTTLPLDPERGARPRQRTVGRDPGGTVRGRRAPRLRRSRGTRSRIGKRRGRTPRVRGGPGRARRGSGAAELGHRSSVVRPAPEGELPRPRDRGLPGGGHGARVLHAAHGGRRPGRARTTSTRTTCRARRSTRSPRSRTTRRTPDIISRSRSRWSSTIARRSGASVGSWPAPRSPRAGVSTASGSPTRWASTSTTGSGSGCWRPRRIAPPG